MSSLSSGHEVVPLEEEELKRQMKSFTGYEESGLMRLKPGQWFLQASFTKYADRIYNFKTKPDDVYIVTYPKCGTTWTQEIIWTMRNNTNFDHPEAKNPINFRAPFIDFDMMMNHTKDVTPKDPDHPILKTFTKLCPGKDPSDGIFLQIGEAIPEPRTFKTHLPLSLLNPDILKNAKVVYVARNPKDVVVSYHHHSRMFKPHNFVGSFDEFVQYFVDDDLLWGPYWLHLKEAWEKRDNPNLHFLFYEDLKEDNLKEIKKLDKFLGTNLNQEQMEKIVKYTTFDQMSAHSTIVPSAKPSEAVNLEVIKKDGGFFRKGKSGDWKDKYTPDQEAKIDAWTKKHLGDCGINFKYAV